jgi:hypothetical protein
MKNAVAPTATIFNIDNLLANYPPGAAKAKCSDVALIQIKYGAGNRQLPRFQLLPHRWKFAAKLARAIHKTVKLRC